MLIGHTLQQQLLFASVSSAATLVQNLNNFPAPTDASTALFVVWVCDADFVGFISSYGPKTPGDTNTTVWTNAISLSLSNHFQALTNLYLKGARTLIMPNAVDITVVPYYAESSYRSPLRREFHPPIGH